LDSLIKLRDESSDLIEELQSKYRAKLGN